MVSRLIRIDEFNLHSAQFERHFDVILWIDGFDSVDLESSFERGFIIFKFIYSEENIYTV